MILELPFSHHRFAIDSDKLQDSVLPFWSNLQSQSNKSLINLL